MKYLIILSIVILSGCVAYPKYEKGMIEACYEWRLCKYYNAIGKQKSDCALEKASCDKYRIYNDCKNKSFRAEDQKFQECWDKLK